MDTDRGWISNIRSPVALPVSFATPTVRKAIVLVNGATGVTLQDLTVDGYGRGNLNNSFIGVAYWNGGGTLANANVSASGIHRSAARSTVSGCMLSTTRRDRIHSW